MVGRIFIMFVSLVQMRMALRHKMHKTSSASGDKLKSRKLWEHQIARRDVARPRILMRLSHDYTQKEVGHTDKGLAGAPLNAPEMETEGRAVPLAAGIVQENATAMETEGRSVTPAEDVAQEMVPVMNAEDHPVSAAEHIPQHSEAVMGMEGRVVVTGEDFAKSLQSKIDQCPGCPNLIASILSAVGATHTWTFVSLVTHMIDMLHDTRWMGEGDSAQSSRRCTRRILTVVIDFVSIEESFNRKACLPNSSIQEGNLKEAISLNCLLSVGVTLINRYAAEYFYGLLAVMGDILKEMFLATEKIKDHLSRGETSAGPFLTLTLSITRLAVYVAVGVAFGAKLGQVADAFVLIGADVNPAEAMQRASDQVAAAFVVLDQCAAVQRLKNTIAPAIQNASTALGQLKSSLGEAVHDWLQQGTELGRACADRVAASAFRHGLTQGLVGDVDDVLAAQEPRAQQATPEQDLHRFLTSFLYQSWISPAHPKPKQIYYWQEIIDRYIKVLDKDISENGRDLNDEARKTQACRVAQQVCENAIYELVVHDEAGSAVFARSTREIDSNSQFALALPPAHPCCLTSEPPTC